MHEDNLERQEQLDSSVALLRDIISFSLTVKQRKHRCSTKRCTDCGFQPDATRQFSRHGCRRRRFLIVIGQFVRTVRAVLPRWRCPDCRRTFTEYPAFAMAHKQYLRSQIERRSIEYVSRRDVSYRTGTRHMRRPIFHGGEIKSAVNPYEAAIVSDVALAHTSLFHWVTAFGAPGSVAAAAFEPCAWKYRSMRRRSILIASYHRLSAARLQFDRQ